MTLSTTASAGHPGANAKSSSSSVGYFTASFDSLSNELIEFLETTEMPPEVVQRTREMLSYNALGGKLNRGMAVLDTVYEFKRHENTVPTEVEENKARMLGWCVELLQASFLVADDVMDASITRRGRPCWYKKPDIGLQAINDSFILRSFINQILRQNFRDESYYLPVIELLQDVGYRTELGQAVDLATAPDHKINFEQFTRERYEWIVQYKTAYYTCYLPVALGMHLCGVVSRDAFKEAEEILLELGKVFQIQDDYLDVFADPAVIGKIGTDIIDNKCSWPIVEAISIASAEQRSILGAHYGRNDPACEATVKGVFKELGIEARYEELEKRGFARVREMVDGTSGIVPKEVYEAMIRKIFKRKR